MPLHTTLDNTLVPTVTPTMNNPLHENCESLPPESVLPAPQRDWRNMTRTIAHYERIEQIGEGTYGQVYRARCKDTNQIVALKKIRVHHGDYWGLPPTILREIKILKRLRHPNLVQMVEVVSSKGVEHLDEDDQVEEKHRVSKNDKVGDAREGYKGNLFLVLEYVSHDLTGLMDVAYRFTEVQIKCIFRQLLEALQYMHDNKYVHRDIKSSNILIDHHFRLKLADFGLARCIEPPILDRIHDRGNSQEFTNKVITLWYRPPELLLGATKYGTAVDIWSAGCILAELILGKPLFTGKAEMEQLQLIFEMLGTPTPETWEGFQDLKLLRTGDVTLGKKRKAKLRDKYQAKMSPPALNLVEKLLELDPNKRLTADRALNSRYFMSEPRAPDRPEELGMIQVKGGHFHEFQTKKKRKEAKVIAESAKQNALEMGRSEKEAQEEFDAMYRGIMEKVAREGLDAGTKLDAPEAVAKDQDDSLHDDDKPGRDKSDRKRRDKEKDKDSRREKKSREDRKKDSKERDREKDRPHRKRSDSEADEKRRKRKREERESRRDPEKKAREPETEQPPKADGPTPVVEGEIVEPPAESTQRILDEKPALAKERNGFSPPQGEPGLHEDGAVDRDGSSRHRSSRSPRETERKRSSRDVRHRSRDGDRDRERDRDRDRSRDRRRRGEGHERDRERPHGRSDRDVDDWGRDPGLARERDYERGRRDRGGRDRPPRDPDLRDDYYGRGPFGASSRGEPGPEFRGGPPPVHNRRDEMGAYGPASAEYRGPPGPRGPPPPGYYDDMRRRDKGRSPRRDRDQRR